MFIQVMREVNTAKEYLNWLVEESGASAEDEGEGGKTLGDVIADTAAGGEVELFGGGGDAPPASEKKETVYQPAMRNDLGSTVLLTGTVDATILNILNNNFWGQDSVPNFEFTTIKALVDNVPAAKKKAISREARYGGLLDKLSIEEASGTLPSTEELAGVSSWIVQLSSEEAGATLPKIADLAKGSADLNNIVVLVTSASGEVEGWDAVEAASLGGDAFKCTLLSVGEIYDGGKEGGFYHVGPVGEESPMVTPESPPKLTRKKAYQLAAHALALDCTVGKALTAYEYPLSAMQAVATPYLEGELAIRDDDGEEVVDEMKDVKMEGRVIQAVREAGFTQVMELDVLVGKGLEAYKEYIANPPVPRETSWSEKKTARDEEDKRILALLEAETAKSEAKKKAEAEEARRIEVEGIANEWAIKEYTLRMLGGDLDDSVSEKDFVISSREEALAEAERTYERIRSDEYIKEKKKEEKAKAGSENKLFWDGMPPTLRKKREVMVEKVKRQYMDLLSEEDLERIILSE